MSPVSNLLTEGGHRHSNNNRGASIHKINVCISSCIRGWHTVGGGRGGRSSHLKRAYMCVRDVVPTAPFSGRRQFWVAHGRMHVCVCMPECVCVQASGRLHRRDATMSARRQAHSAKVQTYMNLARRTCNMYGRHSCLYARTNRVCISYVRQRYTVYNAHSVRVCLEYIKSCDSRRDI